MTFSRMSGRRRRMLGAVTGAVACVAIGTPAAHAAVTTTAGCAPAATSQAFSQWGDTNEYVLAPGGSFPTKGSGWTLSGGARIISASLPFQLGGVSSVDALYLPPGSSAQSPAMCVDPSDPTYRFVGASTGGSTVTAQAVYHTLLGLQLPLATGMVELPTSWGPVPAQQTGAAPVSAVSGGTAQMSVRFTATGGFAIVDDVFVDPHSHWG